MKIVSFKNPLHWTQKYDVDKGQLHFMFLGVKVFSIGNQGELLRYHIRKELFKNQDGENVKVTDISYSSIGAVRDQRKGYFDN